MTELPRDVPLEQLDEAVARIVRAMERSAMVRTRVAGKLKSDESRILLNPKITGLSEEQLASWSAIVARSLSASPRYNSPRFGSRPAMVTLPKTRIVRVRIDGPTPVASERLEPTPLVVYGWACPDRRTALALYWLRGRRLDFLDLGSPESAEWAILTDRIANPEVSKPGSGEPGESSEWQFPRSAFQVVLVKGDKDLPLDRFTLIRNNLVVEASTVEFTWYKEDGLWVALGLKECVADVKSVMNEIDTELIKMSK